MLVGRQPVGATHAAYSDHVATETLASCAETKQAGVAKTTAAIKTRFIMRQIRAPLVQHYYKSGRSVTLADGNGRPTIRSRSTMGASIIAKPPIISAGKSPMRRFEFTHAFAGWRLPPP